MIAFKKIVFILVLFLFGFSSSAQLLRAKKMLKLPKEVNETSGLERVDSLGYLIHNDSFKEPIIYLIDETGKIVHRCKLTGVEAFDMEDIHLSDGIIYVADAGNNYNRRKKVFIYLLSLQDFLKHDSLQPQTITLNYSQQSNFPPLLIKQNFDSESLFKYKDELFIFSKNRGTSTYTYAYRFPAITGDYSIEPYDSFDTGGWITAADIDPQNQYMVLSSHDYLWLFYDYTDVNFFNGKSHYVRLPFSQKESVLIEDGNLLLADERNLRDGFIYYAPITKVLSIDERKPLFDYLCSRPCTRWVATRILR